MSEPIWHQLSLTEALSQLKSSVSGLTSDTIESRRKRCGVNALPEKKPESAFKILVKQSVNPLMVILFIAMIVSVLLNDYLDAWVIAAALGINVLIGFVQEYKASKSLSALRSLVQPKAIVRRDSREIEIDAREIVPGDILVLRIGDRVSADARIIESVELSVNESMLTGESVPVKKQIESLSVGAILADRSNMVYTGTSVVNGHGIAVVVSTGLQTEIGKIALLVQGTKEDATPLQVQLGRLARLLAVFIVVLVAIVFVLGIIFGRSVVDMFNMSVALTVAAIPEGLTVSVTIILAIGMQRILKRRALVRNLVSVETLGSVSVICVDKTGTITEGNMRVTHLITTSQVYDLFEIDHDRPKAILQMLDAMVLCNNAVVISDGKESKVSGSPTEKALLEAALLLQVDRDDLLRKHPSIAEISFSSMTKYMITSHEWGSGSKLFFKGALSRVMKFCDKMEYKGDIVNLTDARRRELEETELTLTKQGLRLIAFGFKNTKTKLNDLSTDDEKGFVFLGFVGLSDPLRSSAKEQISNALKAGIRTVIITGDHPETARTIGKEAGLDVGSDGIVTGDELDAWSDEELRKHIDKIHIFARVEPRHKIRIVDAWQALGEVVAMTGDGVNDAPALKSADIGIAVGSGTEVAKQFADIIILDNDLGTITSAIKEGRVIFDNIRKTTVYLLSGSFTEIVLISSSIILGLPVPLLPAHILWINLVADSFPNVGLTFEPGEKDVMGLQPRKRNEPVINADMLKIIFLIGVITDAVLFILYIWLLRSDYDTQAARSIMFAAVGIDSLFYIFAVKSFRHSIFRVNPFSNRQLLLSVIVAFALMLLAFTNPLLRDVFQIAPLGLNVVVLLLMMSLLKLMMIEAVKEVLIFARRRIGVRSDSGYLISKQ